jgi:hypothetical protein
MAMSNSTPEKGLFPIVSHQKAVLVTSLDISKNLVFDTCMYLLSFRIMISLKVFYFVKNCCATVTVQSFMTLGVSVLSCKTRKL